MHIHNKAQSRVCKETIMGDALAQTHSKGKAQIKAMVQVFKAKCSANKSRGARFKAKCSNLSSKASR